MSEENSKPEVPKTEPLPAAQAEAVLTETETKAAAAVASTNVSMPASVPSPDKGAVAAEPAAPPSSSPPPPPPSSPPKSAAPPAADSSGSGKSSWLSPWIVLAVLALALSGWQWFETRLRLADTQQELAKRLAESDLANKESVQIAKRAQDQTAALETKLTSIEAALADAKSQQAVLETLYQDLARHRDEWSLSEIEQGVVLAAQQLQLAGNVHGAVLALQSADARLASSTRPQFISLRKILARDMDRLKALPLVDLPGMSVRLENVVTAIDSLPLAVDVRPTVVKAKVDEAQPGVKKEPWQQLAMEIWQELRALVRIQRFDRDEPILLAPGQDFFLRENLKLRLLNARLAMLSRDQWTFRNELNAAQAVLERHFDAQSKSVQTALEGLKQLSAAELSIELPTLNDSLSAIRSFKVSGEKDVRK